MGQKSITVTGTLVEASPAVTPCGLITPETRTQAGMSGEAFHRLFFGDQTQEQEALTPGAGVTVTGYIKELQDARGERYWDESAIFVTHITQG